MANSPVVKKIQYCEQTISLRNTLEEGFLTLGLRLHTILENNLYEGRWEDWADFLQDLRMKPPEASKLIQIHRVFTLQYDMPADKVAIMGREVAYDLTRLVKTKAEAQKWLDKGESLRLEDVRVAINESKTGIKQSDCQHPNLIKMCYCPDCHLRERIQ